MKLCVTANTIADWGHQGAPASARYWDVSAFYLYTLAWDPHLLGDLGTVPVLRAPGEAVAEPDKAVVLFARPNEPGDDAHVRAVLEAGGRVVLNRPDPGQLHEADPTLLARPSAFGGTIVSLRERWHLRAAGERAYVYPHMQPFLRLDPGAGQVLAQIGGNPDLLVGQRAAVFAGDPIAACTTYQYMPRELSRLMADLAALLVHVVARFSDRTVDAARRQRLRRGLEVRRDFHAFGFAHLTVRELDRCVGGGAVDLGAAERLVLDAARTYMASGAGPARAPLRAAFEALERENRKLQPVPAIFTDTLHGGELFPDIGYFEIDWPEHPADMLRTYLDWSERRSYRFNVDLGATTVRELALRFPDLFERLRLAHARGRVEFVNGSCNQPYPPFHSLESQIRQFDIGRQVWRDVLGMPPRTYASQEYGFCPQLAAVLRQQGYRQAVVRVQNMGDAPTCRDEVIQWEGPNGERIRALPSHPHKSEQLNQFTYNNMHLKLYDHQQAGLDFAVFTCLGDITFHRPMREELARVCHYAPVFGRFETFDRYFRAVRRVPAPPTRFHMRDFDCDAAFINLAIWPMYKHYTGNYNTNGVQSLSATALFAAAELIDTVAARRDGAVASQDEHDDHWEALTHYQGHGTYIVPFYQSGGFQGPGDNPRLRELGRSTPNVAEYLGPTDTRTVTAVTSGWLERSRVRAEAVIARRLGALAADRPGFVVYSFAPARRRVVRVPGAAGRPLACGGQALSAQDDGADRLVLVDLPAFGCVLLSEMEGDGPAAGPDPVQVGADYLDNGVLRAEFDPRAGTLRKLTCGADGSDLLAAGSHAFYAPGTSPQRCDAVRVTRRGPLQGAIELDLSLRVDGAIVGRMTTCASLDAGAGVLAFDTVIHAVPEVEWNQWENHLGVRFELTDGQAEMHACHFNVLEAFPKQQIFSPSVLLARGQGADVAFLNEGNQFYRRDGGAIGHILVMENESARRLRYAVGAAEPNPLVQAMAWNRPCHVQPVSADGPAGWTPLSAERPAISLFSCDSRDVEILSCRRGDDGLLLRLASTSGQRVRTSLDAVVPIASAVHTSLAGRAEGQLAVQGGRVALDLRPWDICQVRLELA